MINLDTRKIQKFLLSPIYHPDKWDKWFRALSIKEKIIFILQVTIFWILFYTTLLYQPEINKLIYFFL